MPCAPWPAPHKFQPLASSGPMCSAGPPRRIQARLHHPHAPPAHLVEDEQHLVLVADAAQGVQEAGGWGQEAALPHDWLHDDRRRLLQTDKVSGEQRRVVRGGWQCLESVL